MIEIVVGKLKMLEGNVFECSGKLSSLWFRVKEIFGISISRKGRVK